MPSIVKARGMSSIVMSRQTVSRRPMRFVVIAVGYKMAIAINLIFTLPDDFFRPVEF